MVIPVWLLKLAADLGIAAGSKVVRSRTGRRIGASALRSVADKLDSEERRSFEEEVTDRLDDLEGGQRKTRLIAILALAIAIGHVIYAILRDHVFHASPMLG